ncbi:hypothetical protein GUJ93_ZPchr0010g9608 [Zizania palustris]|uniref:Uncharacterized protein n=1 Tax=Zizania palustris TaxID=103762 RepID=A0A8J5TIB3_ZIZPA|nr:hypothetical protein GUJ93_ZPchr0010g9608 [Zizania palustris]
MDDIHLSALRHIDEKDAMIITQSAEISDLHRQLCDIKISSNPPHRVPRIKRIARKIMGLPRRRQQP